MKSDETRKKMSASTAGEKHPMYGKRWKDESRKKMSDTMTGRVFSDPHKKAISVAKTGTRFSDEQKAIMRELKKEYQPSMQGRRHSIESRQRMSASQQGISYDEWECFAKDVPYCPAFNEVCRESNREKYDRQCFLCGQDESENIATNMKQQKLSVHHVDMNKMQGCEDTAWKLVPLCVHCHGKAHGDLIMNRIIYLLNTVWSKVI